MPTDSVIRSEIARVSVFGTPISECANHTVYTCPTCGKRNLNVYSAAAHCHDCGQHWSTESLLKLLRKKGVTVSRQEVLSAQQSEAQKALYASPPIPRSKVIADYTYRNQDGSAAFVNYLVVDDDGAKQNLTAVAVKAVDGSTLWQWGGVPQKDRPLYFGESEIRVPDSAPVVIVAHERHVKMYENNQVQLATCYKSLDGIQAADWSAILHRDIVIFCGFTAEDFSFSAAVLRKLAHQRALAGIRTDAILDSVSVAHMQSLKGTAAFMGSGLQNSLRLVDMTIADVVLTLLKDGKLKSHRMEIAIEDDGATDDMSDAVEHMSGDSKSDFVSIGSGNGKFHLEYVLGLIFKDYDSILYTVDNPVPYLLVRKGKFKNRTFSLASHQYSVFLQHCLTELGNPVLPMSSRAAVEKAVQSSRIAQRFNNRNTYEYMGNTYCLCDKSIYVHYSETEVAVFRAGEPPRVLEKSVSPVQFRPEERERMSFDPAQAVGTSLRSYVDDLFPTVPESLRPLIGGYLVMTPVSYRYTKPILSFVGEAGSGKTTAAVLFKDIVEGIPSAGWEGYVDQSSPKALAAYIAGNVVSIFDNSERATKQISTFLSGIVTGKSYTQRALFTTADKCTTELNSVLLYTSLESPTQEADTADRMLTVRFTGERLQEKSACDAAFRESYVSVHQQTLPAVRAAVLNCAAEFAATPFDDLKLLREFSDVRMGLFMSALTHAAELAGYTRAEVANAYAVSRNTTVEEIADFSPCVAACLAYFRQLVPCGGRERVLLRDLFDIIRSEMERRGEGRRAPVSGNAFRLELRSMRPLLAASGVKIVLRDGGMTVYAERAAGN